MSCEAPQEYLNISFQMAFTLSRLCFKFNGTAPRALSCSWLAAAAEWDADHRCQRWESLPASPFPLAACARARQHVRGAAQSLADRLAPRGQPARPQVHPADRAPHPGAHHQPVPSYQLHFWYKSAPVREGQLRCSQISAHAGGI